MELAERTGTWHAYGKINSNARLDRVHDQFNLASASREALAGSLRFADHLKTHLPEVAANIDAADLGKLHFEVAALTSATREAIRKHDWSTLRKHFDFVDGILGNAEIELHEAIGISYLSNLFYSETSKEYAKARTLLPKRLAVALEIMERHYEDLPR